MRQPQLCGDMQAAAGHSNPRFLLSTQLTSTGRRLPAAPAKSLRAPTRNDIERKGCLLSLPEQLSLVMLGVQAGCFQGILCPELWALGHLVAFQYHKRLPVARQAIQRLLSHFTQWDCIVNSASAVRIWQAHLRGSPVVPKSSPCCLGCRNLLGVWHPACFVCVTSTGWPRQRPFPDVISVSVGGVALRLHPPTGVSKY